MKRFFSYILFTLLSYCALAQEAEIPALPSLKIETKEGYNFLSWVNTYDGLKSVQIQRSADSVLNFVTIGNIAKPVSGVQRFTDKTPMLGKNYYKVRVLFQSELEWFSNTYKVILDSATIAASRQQALLTGSTKATSTGREEEIESKEPKGFYYEPSTQVYTNPYTGHVVISLNDANEKRYSLRFYNPEKEEVLYISRIKKTHIILDKYNFNARGTYQFKLFDGDTVKETGYITIY